MISNSIENQLLRKSSLRLLDHLCNKEISSKNLLTDYFFSLIYDQLSSAYQTLDRGLLSEEVKESKKIRFTKYKAKDYESSFLTPVNKIYNLINSSYSDIFEIFCIHGSISSLDYKEGWSDLDTFAVIDRSILQTYSGLERLRHSVKEINDISKTICSLQHHGVNLITPYDLYFYDESNIPLEIFSDFKVLTNNKNFIKVFLDGTENSSEKRLRNILSVIQSAHQKGFLETHAFNEEYLEKEYCNESNSMYQMKYYLEQFTLLPALFLNLKGYPCNKKDSLNMIIDYFSPMTLQFIEKISYVRSEWPNKEGLSYKPNKIPFWVKDVIPKNYFEVGNNIAEEILNLIEMQ